MPKSHPHAVYLRFCDPYPRHLDRTILILLICMQSDSKTEKKIDSLPPFYCYSCYCYWFCYCYYYIHMSPQGPLVRERPKLEAQKSLDAPASTMARSQMARQELLCDSLALDALHIVFLHPGYRYSYFAQASGRGRILLTLRRQLRRVLNACT